MPNSPATPRPMRRLFQALRPYRARLWGASAYSIANKVLDLMPPFLTAWMIDSVAGQVPGWIGRLGYGEPWPAVCFISALVLLIFALESLTEWRFKLGFLRLAQRVQHDLRVAAYGRMQMRELAYFEGQRTGNLMAILNDDINQLERFLNNSFNEILQLLVLVLVAFASIYALSPLLAFVGLFPVPFILLGSLYFQRKVGPLYQRVREAVGALGSRLENNISGIAVIKSFTAEAQELERVRQSSEDYRRANSEAINWSARYVPIIRMFIALGFAGIMLLASWQMLRGGSGLSLGDLAFFAMMIQRLLWPITILGRLFDEYERAKAAARRFFGLMDSDSAIREQPDAPDPAPVRGEIRLEGLHFGYQAGQPILQGLDAHIAAGQTLGIAGPTGAGKTTLTKLLMRLYDPQEGRILLDGKDVRELSLRGLRQQIGLVGQDVYLFHGSIRDNIAYGMASASQADIEAAARQAQLHTFISGLPDAYDSIVGERGIKLSGGQRQRLSIARALLKNAPILILDEATSAVDTETERAIQANLRRLTQGRTAIIIAHRLSTIRYADHIIVLKAGRVHEAGTHEALLAKGGLYAELWNVQTGFLAKHEDD